MASLPNAACSHRQFRTSRCSDHLTLRGAWIAAEERARTHHGWVVYEDQPSSSSGGSAKTSPPRRQLLLGPGDKGLGSLMKTCARPKPTAIPSTARSAS